MATEGFPGEHLTPPKPLHPAVEDIYRLQLDGTYNAGVAQYSDYDSFNPDEVELIARQAGAAEEGLPDSGDVVGVKLRRGRDDIWTPSETRTIHRVQDSNETYEDFRVTRLSDGSVVACGVEVEQFETETGPSFATHPVDWVFDGHKGLGKLVLGRSLRKAQIDHQPQPLSLDGKNYTPVERDVRLLRLDGEENKYRLHVIRDIGGRPEVVQILDVPRRSKQISRTGTGAPPIKLDARSNNFLLPLHDYGPKDGTDYYYSCTYGVLLKDRDGRYSIPWVDPEALVEPDMFPPDPGVELHAMRRVTYNCGLIEGPRDEDGKLSYFDSVITRGDREIWIARVNCDILRERIRAGILERQAQHDLARIGSVPLKPYWMDVSAQ